MIDRSTKAKEMGRRDIEVEVSDLRTRRVPLDVVVGRMKHACFPDHHATQKRVILAGYHYFLLAESCGLLFVHWRVIITALQGDNKHQRLTQRQLEECGTRDPVRLD